MENEYKYEKILDQEFIVTKSQTASEDTCLTISLMMQRAFLSLGLFSSAKKRKETYKFIIECCKILRSYDEMHPTQETTQYNEMQ